MVIRKSLGLTEGERQIAELCEHSFLKLWSYPNLFKQPGKELCDNLILFGNTIILISEKTKKTPFDYDYSLYKDEDSQKPLGERYIDILWRRWGKELKSSEDQLNGAERWIRKHPDQIYLDSKCLEKFPLTIPNVEDLKFIKISVINGLNKVNKLREQACNNELAYELPSDMMLFKMDLNNIIHLLDDYTFPVIMKELDTVTDFIVFFQKKENLLKSGKSPFGILDLDLLPIYLTNIDYEKCSFCLGDLEQEAEKADLIIIDNPIDPYPEFTAEKRYIDFRNSLKDSYLWDTLIDSCSQDAFEDILVNGQDLNKVDAILRIMAAETRLSRCELSKLYMDVINSFDISKSYKGRAVQSPCNKEIMYVFLQVSKQVEETYDEYRLRRRKLAEMYCCAINANNDVVKQVVVIASEPVKYNSYLSRDFILYQCQQLSSEEKIEILKMQEELHILNGNISSFQKNKKDKIGRNDMCPCGSGLKYKKCCLNK